MSLLRLFLRHTSGGSCHIAPNCSPIMKALCRRNWRHWYAGVFGITAQRYFLYIAISDAFDTIDHTTVLERLHGHFGISVTVFQWFKSYISSRQKRVHIDGSLSCPPYLHFDVPQGSVLGPFLFSLYTTSISQIITTHDISHHIVKYHSPIGHARVKSSTHKVMNLFCARQVKPKGSSPSCLFLT